MTLSRSSVHKADTVFSRFFKVSASLPSLLTERASAACCSVRLLTVAPTPVTCSVRAASSCCTGWTISWHTSRHRSPKSATYVATCAPWASRRAAQSSSVAFCCVRSSWNSSRNSRCGPCNSRNRASICCCCTRSSPRNSSRSPVSPVCICSLICCICSLTVRILASCCSLITKF